MVSLIRRGGKHPLTALALALAIWTFAGPSAMAQHGGHGGGTGHRGRGFVHHGLSGLGGYGFYDPSYGLGYGLGNGGFGVGSYGYGNYGYNGYGYGLSDGGYGFGPVYGYPNYGLSGGYGSTYSNTGFVAQALGFGY
jgi:hypothetical protein